MVFTLACSPLAQAGRGDWRTLLERPACNAGSATWARENRKPSTDGCVRVVAEPQDLARHVERAGPAADGWLFHKRDGRPLPPSTLNSWWRSTVRATGTPGLHLHGLRHVYASGLIAAGCDVLTLQRALGHRSPSTTLDTCSHLWPSAEDPHPGRRGSLTDLISGPTADSARTGRVD